MMEKKYLREIDPNSLKNVYEEEEHKRHKESKDAYLAKTVHEQAPERRDNAILGEDWCDFPDPNIHSKDSVYALHGVGTKSFDMTGDKIDTKTLCAYIKFGLPEEVEICASLVKKDSTQPKQKAFRAVGFVVMPQYITRTFCRDIGSSRRDKEAEDKIIRIRGVRDFDPEQSIEYFGNNLGEYLQKSEEILKKDVAMDEKNNLRASLAFQESLLMLPKFSKTIEPYSSAQRELLEEFLHEITEKNITFSYAELMEALRNFYKDKEIRNEWAPKADLPYAKMKILIDELYKRYKEPDSFHYSELPNKIHEAFVEINDKSRMYNEVFVVNPLINGLYIRSKEDLKQYKLSLDKIKKLFPKLPILLLETWQLLPPKQEEQIQQIYR